MINQNDIQHDHDMLTSQKPSASSKKPRQTRRYHGFTKAIQARYKADAGQMDGRCKSVILMAEYKAELLASLGGADNLSAQELTLLEMCSRDWLLLQSIDAYLLQHGAFNKRKRAAHAITMQRCQIADSLTRRLQALGLKRRSRPVAGLAELLQGNHHRPEQQGVNHEPIGTDIPSTKP